jgi:tetratricopeptide (TPR) repeat protein
MMSGMFGRLCLVTLMVAVPLAACSSAPENPPEPTSELASYDQLFRQADDDRRRGQYQSAINGFKQCVELVRSDPKRLAAVYDNLAIAYQGSGNAHSAIEYFRKATDVAGAHPVYSVHLATAYNNLGDHEAAVRVALNGLRINAAPIFSEPSIVVYLHKQLRRTYRALGTRYGYDRDLLLRHVYSAKQLLSGDPQFVKDARPSRSELEGLVYLADELDQTQRYSEHARVFPGQGVEALLRLAGNEMDDVLEGAMPIELPDDSISEQAKTEALHQLRREIQ